MLRRWPGIGIKPGAGATRAGIPAGGSTAAGAVSVFTGVAGVMAATVVDCRGGCDASGTDPVASGFEEDSVESGALSRALISTLTVIQPRAPSRGSPGRVWRQTAQVNKS